VRRRQFTVADGVRPVALAQTRFPSANHGENVKLDRHQTSRSDNGLGFAGPFGGLGFAVGDAGLRFVGVAEAAVMWRSLPAQLVLDLVDNPYEWHVVAKKVNTRPFPISPTVVVRLWVVLNFL